MAVSKVSLKLLVDTNGHRVLFAEAGKEFVDFLFNILSLPVGTIIRLLTKKDMVGSLANLYESLENLNDTYIQPSQHKDTLLKPKALICTEEVPLFLLGDEPSAVKKFYRCSNCYHPNHFSDDPNAVCPGCKCRMHSELKFVAASSAKEGSTTSTAGGVGEGGFVKGVVTYMVMDDLVVKPMSTISSITLLNRFNIKEVGALEEREVELGINEGLKLLKESLQSKTVLTNVFIGDMGVAVKDSPHQCFSWGDAS